MKQSDGLFLYPTGQSLLAYIGWGTWAFCNVTYNAPYASNSRIGRGRSNNQVLDVGLITVLVP